MRSDQSRAKFRLEGMEKELKTLEDVQAWIDTNPEHPAYQTVKMLIANKAVGKPTEVADLLSHSRDKGNGVWENFSIVHYSSNQQSVEPSTFVLSPIILSCINRLIEEWTV